MNVTVIFWRKKNYLLGIRGRVNSLPWFCFICPNEITGNSKTSSTFYYVSQIFYLCRKFFYCSNLCRVNVNRNCRFSELLNKWVKSEMLIWYHQLFSDKVCAIARLLKVVICCYWYLNLYELIVPLSLLMSVKSVASCCISVYKRPNYF